jgi:uncharacterized protein YqgV (UPF0045/DUF77 family)
MALAASAQISIYPLRQEHLSPAIDAVTTALNAHGLQTEVGAMSTRVTGAASAIFAALEEAFAAAATTGHVVLTVTISNACPLVEPAR